MKESPGFNYKTKSTLRLLYNTCKTFSALIFIVYRGVYEEENFQEMYSTLNPVLETMEFSQNLVTFSTTNDRI